MNFRTGPLFRGYQNDTPEIESASFYLEPASTNRLFDLIKLEGKFEIKASQEGFHLRLGNHRFSLFDSTEFIDLTLHHAENLTEETALVFAELASILFPTVDRPLKMQASHIDDERRLFEAIKHFFPKTALKAFSEDQRFRFEFLERRHQESPLRLNITEKTSKPSPVAIEPRSMHRLMGGFLTQDEYGYKRASIYIESDSIGFLMELARAEGELTIDSAKEHFRLLLRGRIISIENYAELSKIRLLSPMDFGSVELILRVIRFLYQSLDEADDSLESTDTPEDQPISSPSNTRFFQNFINHPALLERPENIINPSFTHHARNIHNPLNPLNPKRMHSPIHLSVETHKTSDEKIVLDALKKFEGKAFVLEHRSLDQKNRFENVFSQDPNFGH